MTPWKHWQVQGLGKFHFISVSHQPNIWSLAIDISQRFEQCTWQANPYFFQLMSYKLLTYRNTNPRNGIAHDAFPRLLISTQSIGFVLSSPDPVCHLVIQNCALNPVRINLCLGLDSVLLFIFGNIPPHSLSISPSLTFFTFPCVILDYLPGHF